MATLNKILVRVPSNLCDEFKTKYVTAATNRDTSYDNKVVFLEKTQEIFTKGKLYCTNNIGDFNDLKALVGTIQSGDTSNNIIDYINAKINSANHINSVSKKSGETLIDVTTSNKAVTVNSTSALTTAVSNANSAIQSVSVLGKTLDKTTNSLTVAEAKTALGLDDLNNQGSNQGSKELEKELGKYDLVSEITFSEAEDGFISTSGTKKGYSSYFISNEIPLKQGNLYLLQANYYDYNDDYLPADMALMAKVDKHEYRTPDGTISTDIVYEPLPNHYRTINVGGYGVPTSHYLVFFATENMNVVISGSHRTIGKTLYEVKYGAFIEAASKLLTINGDLMKVIVEAIVKNKKEIDSINKKMKSLGDIHANSIDLDDFPSVEGEPTVVVANRRPSVAGTNHGNDIPNRIGQIWVDTESEEAYIAVALGSAGDASWKRITIS